MNEAFCNAPAPAPDPTPAGRPEIVARLQESPTFRDYRDAFQMATGLPLVLRPAGSFQPPLHGPKKMAVFCALMGGAGTTCSACLQLQGRIENDAGTEPKTLQCFAGLSESVVAIRVGQNVVGYLQTGQVLLRAPSEKGFSDVLAALEQSAPMAAPALLKAAYFETRVMSAPRYHAVLRLLWSFAQHLATVCNELMIAEATTEPVAVVKARAFIAAHLDEELSLDQVARAAGVSVFYFCKIFRQATGVTFTDYVARRRVEQAKQMLLNGRVRVSEAAFAAGFQSLSQFNRVFRRIEGQAPSSYRRHVHRRGFAPATLGLAA